LKRLNRSFEAFKPHIYLDGAHNISGLKASLNTLELLAEGRPKTIVFAVMADKDYAPMLNLLESVANTLVLTEIPTLRSEKAEVLYAKVNHPHKKRMPDYKDVYDLIKDDPCVLITGSLYFISMIRQALSNENRSKV